uniref:Uncharacterized protein n=1 Tax=Arion vulgaris TaxID=1028688 RepID=A0A0B7BD59_9EUPU
MLGQQDFQQKYVTHSSKAMEGILMIQQFLSSVATKVLIVVDRMSIGMLISQLLDIILSGLANAQ